MLKTVLQRLGLVNDSSADSSDTGIGPLIEQSLAVVFGGEPLGKPVGQAGSRSTVQMQLRLLRHVLARAYQPSADLPPRCNPSSFRCSKTILGCKASVSWAGNRLPASGA
jgi:hypothetical protein